MYVSNAYAIHTHTHTHFFLCPKLPSHTPTTRTARPFPNIISGLQLKPLAGHLYDSNGVIKEVARASAALIVCTLQGPAAAAQGTLGPVLRWVAPHAGAG